MKKFREVFKTKQSLTESQNEKLVLGSFKKVYAALLEKYKISEFNTLTEDRQPAFLAELHSYWDEKKGILRKGIKFLKGNSDLLTEKSTSDQKRNFMKKRAVPAISETFKQSNLKYKLYDIIDEMYKSTEAENLGDILTPKEMINILVESFRDSVKNIMTEINYELNENAKPLKKKKIIKHKISGISKKKPGSEELKESFFNREKSEDQLVAQKLVDWANEAGINAKADSRGFIRDQENNILASVTPIGYVDVSGVGNFAPEELDDNMHDIIEGMKLLVGGRYN